MTDPHQAPDFGLHAALATLQGLLTAGETLEAWAVQHRLFALTHRRVCIAATSGRFISLNRRLLGGYDSADIRWQDLKETRISAGILAADLTLVAQIQLRPEHWVRGQSGVDLRRTAQGSGAGDVSDLPAARSGMAREAPRSRARGTARKIRRRADRRRRARRRGRRHEAAGAESEPARRLRQAREMLEAKLISDSEFESIKAKIVSGL